MKHYVIFDGCYNVFCEADFDKDGYYIGVGEIDKNFNLNEAKVWGDVVFETTSMEKAFEYADKENDKLTRR